MTTTSVDGIVEEYLRHLETALSQLPDARRRQLVAQIKEHIEEARSQLPEESEPAVRNLLDRLGRPEDIAAEALADGAPTGDGQQHRRWIVALFALAILLALGIAIFAITRPSPKGQAASSTRPTTTSPASTSTTRPTTTAPPATVSNPLASGTYANGSPGTPHYFLSVSSSSSGDLTGSVNYLYQDGQTSVVFTFDGSDQNGTATVRPTSVPQNGAASQNPATVPAVISATYGQGSVDLGECVSYLHFAQSLAQCTFTDSPQAP